MWCNTPVVTADQLQPALSVSAQVGEINRRNDTTMIRALRYLRLLAGALIVAMGFLTISPPAHAAPRAEAARSVIVTLSNQTNNTLYLWYDNVSSGIWTHQPPASIPPGGTVLFGTESNGFMTGTSGMVNYYLSSSTGYWYKYFKLYWNNPYIGSNSYKVETFGLDGLFHIVRSGGSGNNTQVTFTLLPN
jgi:hypothetical protein